MLRLLIVVCISVYVFAAPKPDLKELAKQCDPNACELPNCLCASSSPPAGLNSADIPQLVLFTFDDAVSTSNIHYYREAFDNRKNPNDCPVSSTYFTSHEYADYSLIHELSSKGHEIALHSITHQTPASYWKDLNLEGNKKEFADQAKLISHFANIPSSGIQGIRLPFLQLNGNNSFQMIKDSGLVYDCSWPTQTYIGSGLFPYTLDYKSPQDCAVGPCPTASIPGVWVIPMVDWRDLSNNSCAMVDSCANIPSDVDGVLEFMETNFKRHYEGSRSPFGFYVHASWFNNGINFEAYKKFLDYLGGLDDVFLVSGKNVIEWMKNPVNKDVYAKNVPCNPTHENTCIKPQSCRLIKEGVEERYMTVCSSSCPNVYPWLGNPLGN